MAPYVWTQKKVGITSAVDKKGWLIMAISAESIESRSTTREEEALLRHSHLDTAHLQFEVRVDVGCCLGLAGRGRRLRRGHVQHGMHCSMQHARFGPLEPQVAQPLSAVATSFSRPCPLRDCKAQRLLQRTTDDRLLVAVLDVPGPQEDRVIAPVVIGKYHGSAGLRANAISARCHGAAQTSRLSLAWYCQAKQLYFFAFCSCF